MKLLRDDSGTLRSFSEFKKVAQPITELYNKTWLETEYNQAVSAAEMAVKWTGFKENSDIYPNLEYRAVKDGRTRADHLAMDGFIGPIDDPIWDVWFPPNDWGCRCSVTQTDKAAQAPTSVMAELTPGAGFDFNPGKNQKLFADSAGYFSTDKKTVKSVTAEGLSLLEKLDTKP